MMPFGSRLKVLRAVLFYLVLMMLTWNATSAWIAEWVYPLDESSLWKGPAYESITEEIRLIWHARRFVPYDPRYAYRLAELDTKMVTERLRQFPEGEGGDFSALKNFEEAIEKRPLAAEYHARFALFLQAMAELEEKKGNL